MPPSTILVSGDRHWTDRQLVRDVLSEFAPGSTLIHGAARGLDSIASDVVQELGFVVRAFPANWQKYHRSAGPQRNKQMLDQKPDVVIVFHDDLPASRGARDLYNQARKAGYDPRHVFHA